MTRVGVLLLSIGLAAPVAAIDFAAIEAFDPARYSQMVTECDRLAAHPSDPHRVSDGLTGAQMNLAAAIEACHVAIEADPDNPRLNYQLARAYGYSGRHSEGDAFRTRALMGGYPQSLFVMGYIMVTGWDGADPDPCTGGELIRRSAHAGRYAGLVGFAHYYLMGHFDGCRDYPRIDRAEMLEFLERAESADFYRAILTDQLRRQLSED